MIILQTQGTIKANSMKNWMASYLTVHGISFLLSHRTFREIANSGKEGSKASSPWLVGLYTSYSLCLQQFTPLPAQNTGPTSCVHTLQLSIWSSFPIINH